MTAGIGGVREPGGAAVSASRIDFRLKGRLVLRNVSVEIAPGRITAIIGRNGAGKSTLLKCLAGLATPDQGEVKLGERAMRSFDRRSLARQIAYLPQERVVHWPLAVRAVVALGRLPHGPVPSAAWNAGARSATSLAAGRDREAIDSAMRAMDITALAERPVDAISGGERARVLFARALAQEASVILADEPTAGLDPAHALELADVLVRLAADGRAIAVALHDLTLAARFCHDVVIMAEGQVVASGPVSEMMRPEQLVRAFGVTMAVGRIDSVPVIVPVAPLSARPRVPR